MPNLKNIDKVRAHELLFKLMCIFLMLQPVFDVLSQLYVNGTIPIGISTYGKPLFVGILNIALVLVYRKHFWRCAIHYGLYLAFSVVHVLLLRGLLVDMFYILPEIRHMLNLLYLLLCWHDVRILYEEAPDKDLFARKLAKALLFCFSLYLVLYLLAVITGTSGMTYAYADDTKKGFRGWYHSGQIFGHALSMCLPFLITSLLNNKCKTPWLRILCKVAVVIPVLVLCLIGTKVAYYIPLIVLAAQIVLELYFAIKDKQRSHIFNSLICTLCLAACLLAYPITPVYHNVGRNADALQTEYSDEWLTEFLAGEREHHLSPGWKDREWTEKALDVLEEKFLSREIHPAEMRKRQYYFNSTKFVAAPLIYKLFGIGYINQNGMSIERDILCALFDFGIFGFLLILLRPLLLWFRSVFSILRKLFKTDLMTLCLFEGLSMFFFISFYAGYTFLFTQFSIFLTVIMCLLNHRIDKLANDRLQS